MAFKILGSGFKSTGAPARLPVPPRRNSGPSRPSVPVTVKGRPSMGGKGNKRG